MDVGGLMATVANCSSTFLTFVDGFFGFIANLVLFSRSLPFLSLLRSELLPGLGDQLGNVSGL